MSHRQGWAYSGVVIGGVVSVLANVAHSYVRPDGKPLGWSPEPGAVASSIFWPVALFVALEVLVRTDWPEHWAWVAVKVCGLLPIGAVAAVVSYQHLSGLLTSYDESWFASAFGPVAVDGLMVISSAALLASSIARSRPAVVAPDQADAPAAVTAEELDTAVSVQVSAQVGAGLDMLRAELLDMLRAALDKLPVSKPLSKPVSKPKPVPVSNVSNGRERSEDYREAVRRMLADGVSRSTANHRANAAETAGTLTALLDQYPAVRPVESTTG